MTPDATFKGNTVFQNYHIRSYASFVVRLRLLLLSKRYCYVLSIQYSFTCIGFGGIFGNNINIHITGFIPY